MIIKLQGLVNILSKSSFEININDDENVSLSDFHFTFDSIYMIKSNEPFIFDFKTNSFLPLFERSTFKLISFSSNTSYLWIFGVDTSVESKFSLFQYSNREQLSKHEIHLERDFLSSIDDLVIQSTDVNVYLFENNPSDLKCLYQLRKHADLDENQAVKENQLNESSTSCLPLNQILINEKIAQFAAGKEHILFLTESTKRLFAFGIGTKGQLGVGKIENRYELTMVNIPTDVKIRSISSGGWHSAFLSNQNECYIWGWNLNGQVSMSDEANDDSVFVVKPTKLIILDDMSGREVKFEAISLGSRHSSALDINGNVYMFGWNKYGQLFDDSDQNLSLNRDEDEFNVEIPVKIEKISRIKSIKCGCWLTATITD